MKKSRYTESQIFQILKEAETGIPVADLCRKHGMSNATFYKWRAKFGGMDASAMKRLKELEEENARLKRMYADEKLKADVLAEAIEKSGEAISTQGDGVQSGPGERVVDPQSVSGLFYFTDVLSLSSEAQ